MPSREHSTPGKIFFLTADNVQEVEIVQDFFLYKVCLHAVGEVLIRKQPTCILTFIETEFIPTHTSLRRFAYAALVIAFAIPTSSGARASVASKNPGWRHFHR
jgi:hypothetical protein